MSKIIFFHLFIFVTLTLYSQTSPNTIVIPNPTPNPPYISSDTYTRAISSIKLQDGFKWGFVTGSSTNVNLLNLNLGTNPAFVSSAYLGSGSNPNVISCGSVPTIDISKPVGETAGGFQVTGNGAASYNIAITVSPGTKGVQPMLGLSYNSQGGLGLLGVGWNLTGLSAISRTGKVPMHDGVFSGAQLSISDVYSLDGNRLFSLSGTYGQSYTTYYNESENFATITSFGSAGNGPERFEVKDKNGNLLKYGHDNNSSLKGVGDNTTMVWYLNELKDEFGNYMKYFYKQLNGETVIDKIEYTGNASAGLNPYNKITFSYIPLAEHNKTYIKGIEFNQTQLVKDISCWSGSTVFKKYILDYEWQGGSYLSSVKEVDANGIELNPTKFCWDNPNDFDGTKTNQNLDANFTTSDYADLTTIPVDFDGDGFSDFACWNTGIGRHRVYQNTFLNNYGSTNSTINFTNIFDNASQISTTDALLSSNVTDADGNGKQELYTIISPRKYLQSGFTFSDEYTILKTFSNSSNAIQVTSLGTFNTSSVFDVEALPPQMFFGVDDYTGDGVKDNLRIDNESITLESLNSTYVHSYNPSSKSFTRPFNFDGDAVSDYILITDNMTSLTVNVIKFSGSSFYTSSTGNITIQFPNNGPAFKFLCRHISFGDLNGDGLDDLVYINESNSAMYMMKNTGNSFASAVQIQAFTALSSSNAFDISCVDVNADGKKDIIINEANNSTNTTTYYSYLSYGDLILKGGSYIGDWRVGEASRVTYHQFSKNISDYQEVWTRTGKGKVVTGSDIHYADFNGDGIYDYLNLDNSSNFAITNNVNGEPRLSITTIYTPFRNNIQIRYANIGSRFSINNGIKDEVLKPITNPGFVNNIGTYLTNMYCVSHVFNTSGFSGQFQSVLRYLYKNPKHHRYGRGFFGFEEVTSIDLNTMVGTASTSSIDPAYFIPLVYKQESSKFTSGAIGGLSNSNTYSPDGTKILSLSEKTISCTARNTSGHFVQLDRAVSTDFLVSTRQSEEYTYDMGSHGNIQIQTTRAGWNLAAPIKLSTSSFTYANINGVYKPIRQYVVNTQVGETSYPREIVSGYDGQGHLISTTNDPNIPGLNSHVLATTYTVNAFGLSTKISISAPDVNARNSETLYDATGRFVIKSINSIGNFSESSYEPMYGNIVQSTDITGLVVAYQYDGQGRLVKTIYPNATQSKVKYTWESPSNYPYETAPTGAFSVKTEGEEQVYSKEYYAGNKLKLRSESQDYVGNVVITDTKYNTSNAGGLPDGTLIEITEAHYPSQTKYLKNVYAYETTYFRSTGNTTYSVNGTSAVSTGLFTQTNYNLSSNATTYNSSFVETSDATGKTVKKSLNSAGQLTLVTNTYPGKSQKAAYTYYSNGQIKGITLTTPSNPGQNIVYNYSYNDLGQKTQAVDPSRGTSTYQYNTIGELLQSNEQTGTFDYTYDVLGRVDTKTGSTSGTKTYEYFTSGNGKEMLKKITGPTSTTEFKYDNYNRLVENKETITSGNKIFKNNYAYDNYGREIQHTYPNGIVTKNVYNSYGHLTQITDVSNHTLWQLTSKDAIGKIKEYSYGNGISTKNVFNDMNYLIEIDHGNGTKHKQIYDYNLITGDLKSRQFENYMTSVTLKDVFTFDNMDRLSTWKQQDVNTMAFYNAYFVNIDILGNITHKDDAGDYSYTNSSKPFTLSQITNATSNVNPNTLNVQYNDHDKVNQLSEIGTNLQMDFVYSNTEERIKMVYSISGTTQYTRYYSENYEREESSSTYREWTYITAPSGLCAIYFNNNGTTELNYVLSDHLGSPVLLTSNNSSSPSLVEEYSFDCWGRRRNPANWSYSNVPVPSKMIRGYTFHEHLDEFDMINMNARIYDPVLGRFIQADDRVTNESNIQTFNIYAYCNNNPLKYTDPTGHTSDDPNAFDADAYFSYIIPPSTPYYLQNMYDPTADCNASYERAINANNEQWEITMQNVAASQELCNEITSKYKKAWEEAYIFMQNSINSAWEFIQSHPGGGGGYYEEDLAVLQAKAEELGIPWMLFAESQLGIKEFSPGNNPLILAYHALTGGFKSDEIPWCSSFANWCFEQAGIDGTGSPMALSWSNWGERLDNPAYGSLAVINYGKGKGHVGFVTGINEKGNIILLGGNQGDMVKYSAFSPRGVIFVYPTGYTPSYNIPNSGVGGTTSYGATR